MDNFLKDQPYMFSVSFLCITHPKHISNNKDKGKMCIWPSSKCLVIVKLSKNEKVKFEPTSLLTSVVQSGQALTFVDLYMIIYLITESCL